MNSYGSIQNTCPLSRMSLRAEKGCENMYKVLLEHSYLIDGRQVYLGAVRVADIS